jgi:hypothetical protein
MRDLPVRFVALIGIAASVAGCATTLGAAGDSWVGAPLDEFVALAGAPESAYELEDGRITYTWGLGCKIVLIARSGIIQQWSSTNCASIHPVPVKWVRRAR